MPTGLGNAIPSADPTRAPVGHEEGAAVDLGVAIATGVADGMDAEGDGDPELEPPQAEAVAIITAAIRAGRQVPSIQRVTLRCYLEWSG
jgi:hypothetical protein